MGFSVFESGHRDLAWNGSSWQAARWTAWYQYEQHTNGIFDPFCGGGYCASAADLGTRPTQIQYGYSLKTDGTDQATRFNVGFTYNNTWESRIIAIDVKWGGAMLRRYEFDCQQENLGGTVTFNRVVAR